MDLGLADRVALVCGASKGIGYAIAAELIAEGARVAVSSSSAERIADAAAALGAEGFAWDSNDLEDAARLLRDVESRLGPIDILVCNTGGPPAGGPLGIERADWEAAYRSLVLAPMALIERVVPGMRQRGWGRILNVVSTSVIEPIEYLMLSNVHRAATLAAFKTVATDVAADGVTLNSLLPGRIATDRVFSLSGGQDAAERFAEESIPARRLGDVGEMAAAAAFLCSARAGYVTGQWLAVDGGAMKSI